MENVHDIADEILEEMYEKAVPGDDYSSIEKVESSRKKHYLPHKEKKNIITKYIKQAPDEIEEAMLKGIVLSQSPISQDYARRQREVYELNQKISEGDYWLIGNENWFKVVEVIEKDEKIEKHISAREIFSTVPFDARTEVGIPVRMFGQKLYDDLPENNND